MQNGGLENILPYLPINVQRSDLPKCQILHRTGPQAKTDYAMDQQMDLQIRWGMFPWIIPITMSFRMSIWDVVHGDLSIWRTRTMRVDMDMAHLLWYDASLFGSTRAISNDTSQRSSR